MSDKLDFLRADRNATFFPESWRVPPVIKPLPIAPDVKALIKSNMKSIFVGDAKDITVSDPLPDAVGWTTCVKASVKPLSGSSYFPVTYLVEIRDDKIGDRTPDKNGSCNDKNFEPIAR